MERDSDLKIRSSQQDVVRPVLDAQRAEEGRKFFNQTKKSGHRPIGRKKDRE